MLVLVVQKVAILPVDQPLGTTDRLYLLQNEQKHIAKKQSKNEVAPPSKL